MTRRRTRPKHVVGRSHVGERFEVVCGPIAHGGFTVARAEGRVVFVRHSLPEERVVAEVTEGNEGDRFWRADAVEILQAAPGRVAAPCPVAGPGGCGGCDFQHVDLATQRALLGLVVAEQLQRIAGLTREVVVEPASPEDDGFGWRTRVDYVHSAEGFGLRAHRSHRVVPVEHCLIATPEAQPAMTPPTRHRVRHREYDVSAGGFWQPHRDAPETLVSAMLAAANVQPSDRILDLYAGVGLFAGFLGEAAPQGRVWAVEGDPAASKLSVANLSDLPNVESIHADVATWLTSATEPAEVDLVVLDPPRAGAKAKVIAGIASRSPRAIVLVSCDPAAFARDTKLLGQNGYELTGLRAFDLFPMTHHVECVALLTKTGSDLR